MSFVINVIGNETILNHKYHIYILIIVIKIFFLVIVIGTKIALFYLLISNRVKVIFDVGFCPAVANSPVCVPRRL